jgi:hypothetical protein
VFARGAITKPRAERAWRRMVRHRALLLALVVLASGFSPVCLSETEAGSGWTSVTTTRIRPERRERFEAFLGQIMAAYRRAGIPWFVTVQNLAGDTMEYTTLVPVVGFGNLDGPAAVVKVLGEQKWERLSHKIDRCYTAQTRRYAARLADLEIDKADVPIGVYWLETRTLVVQGRMEDYLNWLRKHYVPALQKVGVAHFVAWRVIFGGEGGEVVSSRMLKSLSEIDEGPVLTKALGEEGARAANARLVPLVRSSTTNIVRVRTDLSYSAASPAPK